MKVVFAISLVSACALGEEMQLQLDPRIVVTPLSEVRFVEPAVIEVPEPSVDMPLPDLDVSDALALDERAVESERLEGGTAEPVWTPPDKLGVSVRPVSELKEAAEADAGGVRFGPILAQERGAEEGAYGGGVGLKTEEGLVPEGYQNFTLPPLARDAPTITFRIERCEPDPFADFAARVRRPRR